MRPFRFLLPSFILVPALVLLNACSQGEPVPEATTDQASLSPEKPQPEAQPQRIIRQADLKGQVTDLVASTQKAEAMVEAFGASLASTTQDQLTDAKTTQMVIRVLPEKFMGLLQQLQKESIYTETRTISTQDVALEYVDLQARLKTKQAVEQRFLALMQQAKGIPQILELEQQLQTVREEIESTHARLRYLQNQTAYSTIKVTMYEIVPALSPAGPSFMNRVLEAFDTGWQMLLSLLVGVVYLWPLWFLGLPVFLFVRRKFQL